MHRPKCSRDSIRHNCTSPGEAGEPPHHLLIGQAWARGRAEREQEHCSGHVVEVQRAGGRSQDRGHVPVLAARVDRRARRLALPAQGLEGLPQQQEAHEEQHGREAPRGAALRAVTLCGLVAILRQGNSCVKGLICGCKRLMGLPYQQQTMDHCHRAPGGAARLCVVATVLQQRPSEGKKGLQLHACLPPSEFCIWESASCRVETEADPPQSKCAPH